MERPLKVCFQPPASSILGEKTARIVGKAVASAAREAVFLGASNDKRVTLTLHGIVFSRRHR
jgi:hypothetical protein